MPATHTRYPGSDEQVFPCERGDPVRISATVRLDEAFLWSFGTFSVPVHLWQAMSRYAPCIEPAVLNEWIEVMRGYASEPASRDAHMAALRWLEPQHDTGLVRGLGRKLRDSGSPLFCIRRQLPSAVLHRRRSTHLPAACLSESGRRLAADPWSAAAVS